MTTRAAAAVASVLALIATLLVVVGGGTGAAPGPAAPSRPAVSRPPAPADAAEVTAPARNVFEYAVGDPPPEAAPADTSAAVPPPAAPEPPLPVPVRLIGLVRRGGGLKAAVSIEGRVVVLGPGESAEGYTALTVDEESGARLRGPDGSEMVLPVPVS